MIVNILLSVVVWSIMHLDILFLFVKYFVYSYRVVCTNDNTITHTVS